MAVMGTPGRPRAASRRPARTALLVCMLAALVASATAGPDTGGSGGGLTDGEYNVMRIATYLGASLSVLGTGFIIFTYHYFPELHTFPYKLIVYLSVANFFSSVSYFLDVDGDIAIDHNPGAECYIGAGMSQYFDVASFLWTTVIAFNILQVLVKKKGRAVEEYERWYHLVCWGVPSIFLIIAIATDSFGDAGNWCWITAEHELNRFLLYYFPLMVILIVNSVLYYIIVRGMRESTRAHAINFRLRLYLIVFVFLRVWSAVNRTQNAIAPNHPVFVLFLLHSIFSPLQGFANAMVYGFNLKVRQQYQQVMCASKHDTDNPLASAEHEEGQMRGKLQAYGMESGHSTPHIRLLTSPVSSPRSGDRV